MTLMQPWPCRREPRTQGGRMIVFRPHDGKVLWQFNGSARDRVVAAARRQPPLLRLVGPQALRARHPHAQGALDVRGRRRARTARPRTRAAWSSSAPTAARSTRSTRRPARSAGTRSRTRTSRTAASTSTRRRPSPTGACSSATPTAGSTRSARATGHLLWAQHAGTYVYTAAARLAEDGLRRLVRRQLHGASTPAPATCKWTYDGAGLDPRRADRARRARLLRDLRHVRPRGHAATRSRARARRSRSTRAPGKFVWSFPDGQYSPVVADSKRLYLAGRAWVYGLDAPTQKRSGLPSREHRRDGDAGQRPGEVRGLEDARDEEQHEHRDREAGRRLPRAARAAREHEQPHRHRQPDEQRRGSRTGTSRSGRR